jgi:hypothetical protein
MESKVLLWLDDQRDPFEEKKWLIFSPIPLEELAEIVWVKNYNEFRNHIEEYGVPDGVCFDHDLGDENNTQELTGYDCAKFLCAYCEKHGVPLPVWNCQSVNPIGKENINTLLKSFLKYYNEF